MNRKYGIKILPVLWTLGKEFFCCLPMVLAVLLLKQTGDVIEKGRIVTLIVSLLRGVVAGSLYIALAFALKLPQKIFGISAKETLDRVLRKLHLKR